jgi:hypothetical protein
MTSPTLGAPCPVSGTWVSASAISLRRFNHVTLRRRRRIRFIFLPLPLWLSSPQGICFCLFFSTPPSKKQSGAKTPSFRFCPYRDPGRARPPEAFASASARSIAAYNWSGSVTSIQWCAVATTRVGVCAIPVRLPRAQSASTSSAQCPEGSMTKGIACPCV